MATVSKHSAMPVIHSLQHLPRSPPEIDLDAYYIPPMPSSVHQSADVDMTWAAGHCLGNTPEHTRSRRRGATLSYRDLDVGDSRDRTYSQSHRNLVVVTPPSDLPLHQGHLGHVLSTGPRHRLAQGILMPLFSSMYGQLNAIAREYNFPSIMGLCLYLHINENGVTMTPRISEDSWKYIFGHLFETRPPSGSQQLPIFGRIEFDIDLNRARWFDAWIEGILRDSDPFLPVVTSEASLAAHKRRESQAARVGALPIGDQWNTSRPHTLPTKPRPEVRHHLPKKLSLVDRLDSQSLCISPKLQSHSHHPDPLHTDDFAVSSPAPHSVFPRVAKSELVHHANSWQEVAELYPVLATDTHQPIVDVGESTGVMDVGVYSLGRNFQQPGLVMKCTITSPRLSSIHLDCREDGIIPPTPNTATSWGPHDDEWRSDVSNVSRSPSPDIGEHAIEDILAPRPREVWGNSSGWRSAMTWKDVYPFLATQTESVNRVQVQDPSGLMPQVFYAVDGPQPDTCSSLDTFAQSQTSALPVWGSSFGCQGAQTWNKVYPYSTVTMRSVASIQLREAGGLAPKYPNLRIYPVTYPYFEIYPACNIEEDASGPVSVTSNDSISWTMHYPNLVICMEVTVDQSTPPDQVIIDPAVYPYFNIYPLVENVKSSTYSPSEDPTTANITVGNRAIWGKSFGWNSVTTWRAVWPTAHVRTHTNVCLISTHGSQGNDQIPDTISVEHSPCADLGQLVSGDIESTEFHHQPWHFVWPFFESDSQEKCIISHSQPEVCPAPENLPSMKDHAFEMFTNLNRYPVFDIYPAVYPHFNIYPKIDLPVDDIPKATPNVWHKRVEVKCPSLYPIFDIYHTCHPYNLDYTHLTVNATGSLQPGCAEQESVAYPHFNLYPAVQTLPLRRERIVQDPDIGDLATHSSESRREPETRMGLHASPSQCLEKRRRGNLKAHYAHVFQDGVVRTPSGYTRDLTSLTARQQTEPQVQEVHRHPRLPRLTLGSFSVKSPDNSIPPSVQPALPPTSPLSVRNPGEPSPTSLVTAVLHACPPTNAFMHERSSYVSRALQSTVPRTHGRDLSPTSVNIKDSQFPTRMLSLVGRRQTAGPPEFLTCACKARRGSFCNGPGHMSV